MKNSKEMSDSVIKRIKEHKEKQEKRRKKLKKLSVATISVFAVVLIVAGAWETGILIEEKYTERRFEFINSNANASKNVAAEKHTKSSTEDETERDQEKNTEKKEDETFSQNVSETENNNIETTTQKVVSRTIETPDDVVCYCEGMIGKYKELHYKTTLSYYINEYIDGGNIGLFDFLDIESTIKTTKTSGKAIELIYNTEQEIEILLLDGSVEFYKFDKIFLILDGDYTEFMYFAQNGVYSIGSLKGSNVNCASRILTTFQPELFN